MNFSIKNLFAVFSFFLFFNSYVFANKQTDSLEYSIRPLIEDGKSALEMNLKLQGNESGVTEILLPSSWAGQDKLYLEIGELRCLSAEATIQDTDLLNNDLVNELKLMCERDQEARFKFINSQDLNEDLRDQIILQVDQENLPHLKNIIYQFGWPGFQLVGEEGAEYIWLLVQHCDQDLEFQKICLILLEEAVSKKDAPKKHLAYLMDRVLVNEGKEQIYGTQLQIIDRLAIPFPIKESHELDKRRGLMGLCPFSEYLLLIIEDYHLENK